MGPTTNRSMDTGSPPSTSPEGTTTAAREEIGQLKETAGEAARDVAGTAKEKASEVTSDARRQTAQLAGQTRDQLVEQAGQQKDRAAEGLRAVAAELQEMAEHGQSGLGSQLAQQGAQFSHRTADFLQQHEPAELLDEVRGFARRRPGTFLLGAAVLGVVAGRLSRALASGGTGTSSGSPMSRPLSKSTPDEYLVSPPPEFATPPVTTTGSATPGAER